MNHASVDPHPNSVSVEVLLCVDCAPSEDLLAAARSRAPITGTGIDLVVDGGGGGVGGAGRAGRGVGGGGAHQRRRGGRERRTNTRLRRPSQRVLESVEFGSGSNSDSASLRIPGRGIEEDYRSADTTRFEGLSDTEEDHLLAPLVPVDSGNIWLVCLRHEPVHKPESFSLGSKVVHRHVWQAGDAFLDAVHTSNKVEVHRLSAVTRPCTITPAAVRESVRALEPVYTHLDDVSVPVVYRDRIQTPQ